MIQDARAGGATKRSGTWGGCLVGCLVLALILSVLVIAGLVVAYYALGRAVETYTDTVPMELPVAEVDPDSGAVLEERLEVFREAVEEGRSVKPLVLTENDINALIQTSEAGEAFKGKVCVTLEEEQISGTVSLPLDEFNLPFVEKGRYFNASVTFSVFLRAGRLHVYFNSAKVKDNPLPDWLMTELSGVNFAEDVQKDPETRKMLDALESIEVRDGSIKITPKRPVDPDRPSNSAGQVT